eukprot:7190340-Alexandrium_andersonii.AAC.1
MEANRASAGGTSTQRPELPWRPSGRPGRGRLRPPRGSGWTSLRPTPRCLARRAPWRSAQTSRAAARST